MSLNNIIIPLLRHLTRQGKDGIIIALHYILSSVIGQDKSNLALWLATRPGKMALSCPLGTTCRVPQEKFPESLVGLASLLVNNPCIVYSAQFEANQQGKIIIHHMMYYSTHTSYGRRGGLMVSALVPGASGPGSSPGRVHCVVFLGKTLSQCLSPRRSTILLVFIIGENLTNCGGLTCDGRWPTPGGVEILLAVSCYRNRE